MSRKKTVLLLAFALLTALTLGCGLLDSLKKKAVDEGAQLVEQGKATVQAAVTEAAPDKTPDTEPLSETAEPTEAPTEPASKPTGDGIDLAALSSMDSLNSFRMVASINWTRVMTDGTSESGSMRMLTERDRAAQASRLSIEGALPDAVPSLVGEGKTMELIQIGTSMYVNTGDGEWMAMQMGADQVEDQFSWDADPRDFARGQGSYEGRDGERLRGQALPLQRRGRR
ncbi:MAG TPA: hypothetical protein GX714_17410 [Chloroflexi bacterium]|jgi:hypothetical protein|nr:hypothetical protein [Chloroflexota bacterium]